MKEIRNQIIGVSVASAFAVVGFICWAVWEVAQIKTDFEARTESRWSCHDMELWVRDIQAKNSSLGEHNFPMPECHDHAKY